MPSVTKKTKGRRNKGPVSVPFPPELRRRAEAYARGRNLQLASAIRLLVTERLEELDDQGRLSRAEEWQRAEAWATWERFRAGEIVEVERSAVSEVFARARARSKR